MPAWNALLRLPAAGNELSNNNPTLLFGSGRRASAPATGASIKPKVVANWCDQRSIQTGTSQKSNVGTSVTGSRLADIAECGGPPGNTGWEEEIAKRDEQIRILKKQLLAAGEQPVEEIVTLEVEIVYWFTRCFVRAVKG